MNEIARAESFEPEVDQFSAWREALATGKPVAYERGAPTAGCYKRMRRVSATDRTKIYDVIGIWFEDGEWTCRGSGGFIPRDGDTDEIEGLFVSINSQPISFELYESIMAGGTWPEEVAKVEDPEPELAPHEAAAAYFKKHKAIADAWLAGLKDADGKPRKPNTKEESDLAANYADTFGKIETRAEKARAAEKAPHILAGNEVDAKWNPIKEAAKLAKVNAKALSEEFARAENARRKREADEENVRRQREFDAAEAARLAREAELRAKGVKVPEMAQAPAPEPPKAVVAEPVRVGTVGRRQSLRTFTTYALDDSRATLEFLAKRNIKSAALLEAALADAKALHAIGTEVPGLKVGTEERMV
jgi:hypothetical protein